MCVCMCSYVCLLLAMAASLGAGLASVEVVHRPPVSLQREEFIMTGIFPGSIQKRACLLHMIIYSRLTRIHREGKWSVWLFNKGLL